MSSDILNFDQENVDLINKPTNNEDDDDYDYDLGISNNNNSKKRKLRRLARDDGDGEDAEEQQNVSKKPNKVSLVSIGNIFNSSRRY